MLILSVQMVLHDSLENEIIIHVPVQKRASYMNDCMDREDSTER
jgi:hypothetical protein